MSTTITWADTVDQTWSTIEPIRIGDIPSRHGTPEQYILVSRNDQAFLRVDAYRNFEESFTFKDAVLWHGFLVVGWGHRVYLIHTHSRNVINHKLDSYFGHIYCNADYLLVASGEHLLRIASDGSIAWQSTALGIDGVIVHEISNGIIKGDGEWDPPGGWKPFQIRLESGLLEKTT